MTQPTTRIIQLAEHIATIGAFTVSINRRTKKLTLSMGGHRDSHTDAIVTDHLTQAILDLMAGVCPADIARSGGHVTRVWAENGELCIQTQGPHPGALYRVAGAEQVIELISALHRGRMMLDGRAA